MTDAGILALGLAIAIVAGATLWARGSATESSSGSPPSQSAPRGPLVNSAPLPLTSVSGPMPLPPGSPPAPDLGQLLPSAYHVVTRSWVRMAGSAPQVVVATTEPSTSVSALSSRSTADLLVYSWAESTHRWANVFDAAKSTVPVGSDSSVGAQQDILPQGSNVEDLTYAPITSTAGQTDLAFWAGVSFGVNSPFDEYIVHFDGRLSSIAFSSSGENGRAVVAGTAPHQDLSMTAQWVDPVDRECCGVRKFTQVVSWDSTPLPGTTAPAGYQIVTDTRSWAGVYLDTQVNSALSQGSPPAPPTVLAVVPGSPAAGVLQRGDLLLSVAGAPKPPDQNLLGPEVIEQIDSLQPGTRVAITVERGGQDIVENLTLSSYADPAEQGAQAPFPSYLGVEVNVTSPSPTPGAYVAAALNNAPAAQAGLTSGDVITAVGGTPISSDQQLTAVLLTIPASTAVQVAYTDPSGQPHTANVTLGAYPNLDLNNIPPQVFEL